MSQTFIKLSAAANNLPCQQKKLGEDAKNYTAVASADGIRLS